MKNINYKTPHSLQVKTRREGTHLLSPDSILQHKKHCLPLVTFENQNISFYKNVPVNIYLLGVQIMLKPIMSNLLKTLKCVTPVVNAFNTCSMLNTHNYSLPTFLRVYGIFGMFSWSRRMCFWTLDL